MKKIEAIIRPERLSHVRAALDELGLRGLNVVPVSGSGQQRGVVHQGRGGEEVVVDILPRLKVELVITDSATELVLRAIAASGFTGEVGDGRVFVLNVADAIRIRTGERGDVAL